MKPDTTFRITLDEFEGPLDLLLFFIKRDELDIYNIPISKITTDFISYIDAMQSLNLEVAAEFIYMASLLMSIKVKMLLPREMPDDSDADEFDPRTELVERLLEYKQIKEGTAELGPLEARRAAMFSRGCFEDADPEVVDELDEPLNRPTLYNLIMAYKSALDRVPQARVQNVEDAPVTVDEQCAYILSCLSKQVQVSFRSILDGVASRLVLVVTFLAVLDLCRRHRISVITKEGYDDFWMSKKETVSST
ncbi:segregation/condensation protein A [Prosthecochloris sp. N3]|uniref:Segregation and condensation protein A n=1 Tax=Prosthecochloris ethylica TaxID=2743976 RepID=A0ABR9XT00_9CHLB|nr:MULTISPECIES: segregation/condensation protein A [Prosthecochloris]MBF0585917.1 segregation/condensation protein A [Prosthecochloris ethylica]MBF0637078.1 segregation/condensation protein A [Prosthecochloris ethylica]NUK47315.1 segregation/condensation protein A [Prosthecochloris ethylica]RNA64105.1 chromosome segregation protein ScpA [Prosthecochloris sp. ZM_2]